MSCKLCSMCTWWVKVGLEDIELNDESPYLIGYGICANDEGEGFNGDMWVKLNTNNRFARIWENKIACEHFKSDEVSK